MSSVTVSATRRATFKYVGLAIIAIGWTLLPLWLIVVNSFKTTTEASTPSISLPTKWVFSENYRVVFTEGHFFAGLRNSITVAVPTVLAVLLLGSMAAWAFARSDRMTLRAGYYVMALSIILPPAIVPTVWLLTRAGLTGGLSGYILALVGTRLGVMTFLATGYIRTLPTDLEQAAQIDGANRWQVYWHVILPLLRPILFTVAVMTVINVWNDFFFALYMLKGVSSETLPLTLYNFANSGAYTVNWNLVFAQVLLSTLPMLLAYVVLQRRILSGLTDGAVTG